jgi:energy-converting hydrogenase Eha subunit H
MKFLIIGLCILLRVYQSNIGITSVRNKVFFSARFYYALITLHVSTPFGGHLQVVHIVTTLNIFFVFMNHLKMAAKRDRNMQCDNCTIKSSTKILCCVRRSSNI